MEPVAPYAHVPGVPWGILYGAPPQSGSRAECRPCCLQHVRPTCLWAAHHKLAGHSRLRKSHPPPSTSTFFQNPRSAWLQLWWSGLRLAANFRTTYLFNTIFNFGNSKKFYKAHPRTLQCNFRDLRNAEATTEKAKLARSTFLSSTQDFTITFDPTDSRTWPIPMTRLEEKIFPKTVSKELHKTEDWALPSERRDSHPTESFAQRQ